MFTLRTITDSFERNNYLGNDFEVIPKYIYKGENIPLDESPEFKKLFEDLFHEPEINDTENVFAVVYTGSLKIIPLYCHLKYYVLNEKGKTFMNLTFKTKNNEKNTESPVVSHFEKIKDIISGKPCPFPIDVIPNRMGINLCSVDSINWHEKQDGQLISLQIHFIPDTNKCYKDGKPCECEGLCRENC